MRGAAGGRRACARGHSVDRAARSAFGTRDRVPAWHGSEGSAPVEGSACSARAPVPRQLSAARRELTAVRAQSSSTLFIATGSIVDLGLLLSRFTGEHFTDGTRPPNAFDARFFLTVGMSPMGFAVAIPCFLVDYTSLPRSVDVLAGLMWPPVSWIIRHWGGNVRTVARAALVTASKYIFPTQRFAVNPAVIVATFAGTIVALECRCRARHAGSAHPSGRQAA